MAQNFNNYQDNLNKFKYRQTDIFNSNEVSHPRTVQPAGKKVHQKYTTDIFSLQQVQPKEQKTVYTKPDANKSNIFSGQAEEQQQKTHSRINTENIQKSDIFMQSPSKQQAQKSHMKIVDQSEVKKRHQDQEKNKPLFGKRMDDNNSKRSHHDQLIFSEDKSYQVKRDKQKDYSQVENVMQQKRDNYKVHNEKFGFMKSKMNYGDDNNELYQDYKQSDSQQKVQKEKAAYNSMWWQDTSAKTSVNENAVFDKNYAKQKFAVDQQSSIFMSNEQDQNRQSIVIEQQKKLQESQVQLKQNERDDINNRKKQRNYSNLNGYEQQYQKQNTNQQQGLIPTNLSAFNCDSRVFKIKEAQEVQEAKLQQENQLENQPCPVTNSQVAQNKYLNQMKSALDANNQQQQVQQSEQQQKIQSNNQQNNQIQQQDQQQEQQQQCQVVEDFGNLNDKEETKSVHEPEGSQKKQDKQLTEDPQKLETWEVDPYKDRVSLLAQRKPQVEDVTLLQMDLKGLNEKFDVTQFKKVCARKGYHLVDLDVNYSFNKMTGRGKLLLRNNRKVADGPDSIKSHLQSLGVGIIRENDVGATIENNQLKLEPAKQKKKLFSQPEKLDDNQLEEQREKQKSQQKRVSQVSSSLYNPKEIQKKADLRKKEKQQQKELNDQLNPRGSLIKKPAQKSSATIRKSSNQTHVSQKSNITQKTQNNNQSQVLNDQQPQSNNGSQLKTKNEVVQNLISNNNNNNTDAPPPVIKKKRQNTQDDIV